MGWFEEKIDEKLEVWLEASEIDLTTLDNNSNIKTNFMWCQRNFDNLKKWLGKLLEYVRYIRSLIDIDNILKEMFKMMQEKKITIPILHQMDVNPDLSTTYTDPTFETVFFIKRLDVQTVEISAQESNWITDKLMVTVKDVSGIINYPVVKTANNKITIYFPDGISTNYQVMII